jgi:hypothetical protein
MVVSSILVVETRGKTPVLIMKQLFLPLLMFIFIGPVIGQKKIYDPSYSVRNYKHPNKVRIARANNLDKIVPLKPVVVTGGQEYKHRFNQSWFVVKASVRTRSVKQSRITGKHSLGL